MKSRNLIFFVGVVSLLFFFNLNVAGQTNKRTKIQPPVRFMTISNDIVAKLSDRDEDRRDIVVLVRPENFSESSMKGLFIFLSRRFPKPRLLYIDVYTNRKDLGIKGQQPLMHLRGDDAEMAGDLATFTRVDNNMEFSLTFKNGESYWVEIK